MYQFHLTPQAVAPLETPYRRICTAIPNPVTLPVIQQSLRFETHSMNDQLPVVWDRARDFQVFDVSGNCWIDLTSTIFVANVGHGHPAVCKAIIETTQKQLLNAYYYQTPERANLAELLVSITPPRLEKVLFLSTGSEATEATYKMTRLYGARQDPQKTIVVAFEGSFHGKTMGSQTLGGKPGGKRWIKYHHPEIVHLPYPYPWVLQEHKMSGAAFFHHSLQQLASQGTSLQHIAGFFAEPYQGWCAVFFPTDYMQALRAWATQHDCILGFDEVQAGFGRTGKLFGFEHFGVEPDVIWCGKGISSSLPLSAVIGRADLVDCDLSLNSTHGGNPVAAAASYASVQALIAEDLVAEAQRKGHLVERFLRQWHTEKPHIVTEIYGAGLVWGILIRDPHTQELAVDLVDRVIERAFQKGVLSIRTCCGTLKLGPPLTIPDEALVEALQVLKDSLDEVLADPSL